MSFAVSASNRPGGNALRTSYSRSPATSPGPSARITTTSITSKAHAHPFQRTHPEIIQQHYPTHHAQGEREDGKPESSPLLRHLIHSRW